MLKRSWLKRGSKVLSRGTSELRRAPLDKGVSQLKRSRISMRGSSDTSVIKESIQALVREIVIIRDGGCIFRHYPEAGKCGGRRKDGELILQFDHLNSRVFSISYADTRLGICACERHHIKWKPQNSDMYSRLARKHIGEKRSLLLTRVQENRSPNRRYSHDWRLEEASLRQELKKLKEVL